MWKYALDRPQVSFDIPVGGRILAVAWQRGNPTMWIEVDLDAPLTERQFIAVPTGEPFELQLLNLDGRTPYIGSAVGDELVFHVYELFR